MSKIVNYKVIHFILCIALFIYSNSIFSFTREEKRYIKKMVKEKYGLKISRKKGNNLKLYNTILDWEGTPYKYGGKDRGGIDCSSFVAVAINTAYKKKISGSAASLFTIVKVIENEEDYMEGDIIFFKIDTNRISHVGVFLKERKFAHSTVKSGVRVDDLDENYYKTHFFAVGRLN